MRTSIWIALMIVVAACMGYLTWRVTQPVGTVPSYDMTGSIKEIMEGMIEPGAETIFQSVSVVNDASGEHENLPRTEEDWAKVEHAALTLAEAANLLRMPGRAVAPAGDNEPDESPAVPELTPQEIHEKIDADPAEWNRHTAALIEQARRALGYARAKDVNGLFQFGGDLDQVCEDCHLVYWYPNGPKGPS